MITRILVASFIICLMAASAFADGLLIGYRPDSITIVRPGPAPAAEALPVKYHRVQVDIDNGVATTSVDEVFRNDSDYDLEGVYIFPVPETASISGFSLYVDGKKAEAELLDAVKAREVYEDTVRKMRDPGLLEYAGRNMFRVRIYPIPKHGERRIELSYQQALTYDAGLYRYVYPLNTEKFSPKPLEEVSIAVKVKSNVPIKNIYSPSHSIDTKLEEYNAVCGYEAKGVKPDKDFILYYTVSEKAMGLNLLTYRKAGEDGYFMLLLAPGRIGSKAAAKDIVFVLDTSGSMEGEKIRQAKDALKFCVNSLGKDDRFNIVTFATSAVQFKNSLVKADPETIKEAIGFIDSIDANGGTDIHAALLGALKMFSGDPRPRMLAFLTDGEATVGITDMKEIVKDVNNANTAGCRLFVFGLGSDVNTHLLDRLADDQHGTSEYVLPGENIEVKVSSFYRKVSEPILADIRLDYGKIKVKEVYPINLPDIFKGSQMILLGRYEGEGTSAVTLTGHVERKEQTFVYEGKFPDTARDHDFIPRLWATRKIGYLAGEIRLKGETKELVDEIVRLSKTYSIMTAYTSYLVLDNDKGFHKGFAESALSSQVVQEGAMFKMSMARAVGADAVNNAVNLGAMKDTAVEKSPVFDTIKQIGDKTFYLQEGRWVDGDYKEGMKTVDMPYMSAEYLRLLASSPAIGKYLALGRSVTVVFDNMCYKVTATSV
ncbi:MAG: VIT domain-containing protein [Candidatus Omnitrophica bacterium]|nr:VIT domain-containing protein [Candidatus Omnitrophota bacterium]